MSKFDETKFIVTGDFIGPQKFTYQVKMNTAPRGVTSGGTFKNTLSYKISNINRKISLKFTHGSTLVTVRRLTGDHAFENHTNGVPIFIGDTLTEFQTNVVSGTDIGTIASIASGTEGVNVKTFNLSSAVTLAIGSGTLDAVVNYNASYSSEIDLSTIAIEDNAHTSNILSGLSISYKDGATVQTWPSHLASASGSTYYEVFNFTALPQASFYADSLGKIIKNSSYDIIGWDKANNTLKRLKDVYNNKSQSSTVPTSAESLGSFNISDNLTFNNRGDDLYIGTGKDSNPIYYGYPNVVQFGKRSDSSPVLTDGPTLVVKSIIPKFEQFVCPLPSDGSGHDMYATEISESSWDITSATQEIIGYEKGSVYLLKATKDKGVEETFYAHGVIEAIRLNNRNTRTMWVLSNAQTHYLVMLINIGTMTIEANRIYKIKSASGEQHIPSATSTIVKLSDILFQGETSGDGYIYIQASDKNIDNKPLSECVFGESIESKKAYVWRSAQLSSAPGSTPDIGYTDLEFTNITPSMSPSVKTILTSPTENTIRTPYWYYFESGSVTTEGERPGDSDQTNSNYIQNDGFSTIENLLTGDEFPLLQTPAKRGLVDYNRGSYAIGVVIPYVENSVSENSVIKESGEPIVYDDVSVSGQREIVDVQGYKIGPFVTQSLSIPDPTDSYHHLLLANKDVLLGSHIQVIHDAKSAISGDKSNPTSVKRIGLSTSTDDLTLINQLTGVSNEGTLNFYGDGAQFEEFKSISSIISHTSYAPFGLAVTEGSRVHGWSFWQNSDRGLAGDIHNGTAQAGSTTTITLASGAHASNDHYNGKFLFVKAGTGAGSELKITDYNGTTKVATFTANGETYDNTSQYYITAKLKQDNSSKNIKETNLWSFTEDKTIYLNLTNRTLIHRSYTPSIISGTEVIETVPPAMLMSQEIAFDEQGMQGSLEGTANFTAVLFPNDDFNLYYLYEMFLKTSNTAWSYLTALSTLKISVTDSGSSIKDDSMLLPGQSSGADANYKSKFYRVSLMYDGYQESRLSKSLYSSSSNPHAEGQNIKIDVLPNKLNPRISHINIYRGTALSSSATEADTIYSLVKSIPFNGDGWSETTDGYLSFNFNDNKGTNLGSYEALTGISEEMNSNWLNYSISEECAGYLFVSKANNSEISETDNYVFRSKAGKFNIFNWANEYCALPESINCLKSYNNFLYAFSESSVYTINPSNLSIVDKMDGQGTLSDNGAIATDYGMFFADRYGVYIHNGKGSQLISRAIEYTDNSSLTNYVWSNIDWISNPPKLAFDSQRKALLIFFVYNNSSFAWVYSVFQKRWDLWSFNSEIKSVIQGKYGEILASDGKLFQIATGGSAGNTRKAWEYQSKKVTAGFDTYEKQFKEIHSEGTTGLAIKYKTGLASGAWNALSSESTGSGFTKGRLNTSDSKSKWLQIQVIDSNGTKQLESLGIHLRPLKAKSTRI